MKKSPLNADIETITLQARRFCSAVLIEYTCQSADEIHLAMRPDLVALQASMDRVLMGQPLMNKTVRHPADWQSHACQAFVEWAREYLDRRLAHPVWCLPCWLVRRARDWAARRVRWVEHHWEVRREWLDVQYEGQRTRVVSYYNGHPAVSVGPSESKRRYREALSAVMAQMQPRLGVDEHPIDLVHELIRRAQHTDWWK